MTITVAVAADDGVWIGSDTLLSAGNRRIDGTFKWFQHRNWAMSIAGDWRVGNVLEQHRFLLLSKLKDEHDFIGRVYKLFEDKEIGRHREDEHVKTFGQNILLAKRNTAVYEIDCELSVTKTPFNIMSTQGSGREYAAGCYYGLAKMTTEERLRKCIEAACYNCIDCGGEIIVKKL